MQQSHPTVDDELAEISALRLRIRKCGADPIQKYDRQLEGMALLLEAVKLYLPVKPLH